AQGATVVTAPASRRLRISGSITMLHDGNGDSKIPCPRVMPPECAELMEQGVVLFHGEAEGIWHAVLGDIARGEAKPLYRGPNCGSAATSLRQLPFTKIRPCCVRPFRPRTVRSMSTSTLV